MVSCIESKIMRRREWVVIGVEVIAFGLLVVCLSVAQEGPTSALRFVVIRDYNGKPVKNAAVVLHPVNESGKQARGGIELKTDTEGRTNFDGVPYGPLRVQVLMSGFQTFGDDYDVNKPEMEITIRLKRPQGQYSIYQDQAGSKKSEDPKAEKKDEQKPPEQKSPEQKPQ